jgi:hypothetical protein
MTADVTAKKVAILPTNFQFLIVYTYAMLGVASYLSYARIEACEPVNAPKRLAQSSRNQLFNCLYIAKKAEPINQSELNDQGDLDPKTDETMQRAQKADLITLPGGSKTEVTNKKFCKKKLQMLLPSACACAYWDNEGAWRPWKQKKPMEQMIS